MTAAQIVVFLVLLSVLVVLHEYGHFFAARRNGVRVTDFAVGFGPTILRWTSPRSGTNYRLNLLPMGGYCQMKGEDGKSEAEQQREFRTGETFEHDNFQAKRPWQRLAIIGAGPVSNFITALVILFVSAVAFGVPSDAPTTMIYQLLPNYPAQRAGMLPGDRIVSIDGKTISDGNILVDTINRSLGKPIRVVYERNGRDRTVTVTPIVGPDGKQVGHLGFQPLPAMQRVGVGTAAAYSWDQFSTVVTRTFGLLGSLVRHPSSVAGQITGPIGMARATAQAEQFGPPVFLFVAAMISISLGIINLLPIPAMDGGRAVFIIVEMLRGRPVDPEKEALVHVGGFAVLIVLMLAVSYHDVAAAIAGRSVF